MPYTEQYLFILMSRQRALPYPKRHESVTKSKAARGRTEIQNIPKRCGDAPHSKIFQSGNKLPHSKNLKRRETRRTPKGTGTCRDDMMILEEFMCRDVFGKMPHFPE